MSNKLNFTAIIEKSIDGWYVGQLQEFPSIISQGKTIDELMQDLKSGLDFFWTMKPSMTIKNFF